MLRVLVDLTNSPHVPLFAPLVRALEHDGHEVHVVARRFAQTVELAELHGLRATVIGRHGGTSRLGKAHAAIGRTAGLLRHARGIERSEAGGPIDVALSHGSTDLPIVARLLDIPHVTMFDYEWARTMHRLNCRASWRVVVPDTIPLERLEPYGAMGKVATYPGLKEEYYLGSAPLDDDVRATLGVPGDDVLVLLRPPADMALYHRGIVNDVFGDVLARAQAEPGVTVVVLARTDEQRARLAATVGDDPSVLLPEHAIDGPSLVAASDVVVSAGGTMNREAAALGVPVYTVFAGRMGGVDEGLIADGRLQVLGSAEEVAFVRRGAAGAAPALRDPRDLLHVLLRGLPVDEGVVGAPRVADLVEGKPAGSPPPGL